MAAHLAVADLSGLDILDRVIVRISVVEIRTAVRAAVVAGQRGILFAKGQRKHAVAHGIGQVDIKGRAVDLCDRIGDRVMVLVADDRVRCDNDAVIRVARADRAADLVDDLGVGRRAEHTLERFARAPEHAGRARADRQHHCGCHAHRRDARQAALTRPRHGHDIVLRPFACVQQVLHHARLGFVRKFQASHRLSILIVIIIRSVHSIRLPVWCAACAVPGSGAR